MLGTLIILGVIALVTVLPIKLAAEFTDGTNTGLLACAFAALAGPAISVVAFRLALGGLMGFSLAVFTGVATYAIILRIPGKSIIGFAIITVALQLAVIAALVSMGSGLGDLVGP